MKVGQTKQTPTLNAPSRTRSATHTSYVVLRGARLGFCFNDTSSRKRRPGLCSLPTFTERIGAAAYLEIRKQLILLVDAWASGLMAHREDGEFAGVAILAPFIDCSS
jgi:hypothetical protein